MQDLSNIVQGSMLMINKPESWTSFDVVNKIRGTIRHTFQLKKIKVGHAGTLDPLATGLLIVCTGRMTKQIDTFQGLEKRYTGVIKLGATTATYDREADEDQIYPIDHLNPAMIREAAERFVGDIMQKPPIFSAIKKDGVRLYKSARANKEVEIEPRKVHISSFELSEVNMPYVSFDVRCSKGTYIRSLAYDLGIELKTGGYLMELVRTHIGEYALADAWELDTLIDQIKLLK